MIPLVIPPLSNLHVLVTRPAQQSQSLCNAIVKLGGEVIRFPVLDIKPRQAILSSTHYDLIIFVSANAVINGAWLFRQLIPSPQVAVIGHATATALQDAGIEATIIAGLPFSSEALLQHEALQSPPARILLIKGTGGRHILRDTLIARGAQVDAIEVYERVITTADAQSRSVLQLALRDGTVDVITVTSMDIAHALSSLLDAPDLELAQQCMVLAGSVRIAMQLPALGWKGERIVSDSPDDDAMLRTLICWHTRRRN